jgi:hypothetical protein
MTSPCEQALFLQNSFFFFFFYFMFHFVCDEWQNRATSLHKILFDAQ